MRHLQATPASRTLHGAHASPGTGTDKRARRAWWQKALYQWHWVSSALCLAGMLLFSITGITLNHSGAIEAKPKITVRTAALPSALQSDLLTIATDRNARAAERLPDEATQWVYATFGVVATGRSAEWSADEVYLPLPRPGGDAWLRLDLESGEAEFELTDRGWIAWANDLHKGRNSGAAWSWFIDIFAVACVVFTLTGLFILWMHARNRPMVWPMVGLGVAVPLLLIILFID